MKDECYKKHRRKGTIRIGDVMFIVTGDEYAQYYAELERKKYVRRQERGKRISYEEALEDGTPIDLLSANPQISVEEEAEKNVLIELMLNAIEQLDAADKQLIRLLFFYEFSCREISRQLGVDEGTIRYRKNKILQKGTKENGVPFLFQKWRNGLMDKINELISEGIRKDFCEGNSKMTNRICYGYEQNDYGSCKI